MRSLFIAGRFERDIVRADGKTRKLSVASARFIARICRPDAVMERGRNVCPGYTRVHTAGMLAKDHDRYCASFNIPVARLFAQPNNRLAVVARRQLRICACPFVDDCDDDYDDRVAR